MSNRIDLARMTRKQTEQRLDRILAKAGGPRFTDAEVSEILCPLGEHYVSEYGHKLRLQSHDRDDATQNFYLRLRRCLEPVQGRRGLQTLVWGPAPVRNSRSVLRRLAELSVRDELRRRRSSPLSAAGPAESLEVPGPSFTDEVERRDALEWVVALAEQKLKGRALEYWRLYFVDQLSVSDIAERCRVSPQRVRESNCRSNQLLSERLLAEGRLSRGALALA